MWKVRISQYLMHLNGKNGLRCYILCPQVCADPAELDMAFSQLQLVEKCLGYQCSCRPVCVDRRSVGTKILEPTVRFHEFHASLWPVGGKLNFEVIPCWDVCLLTYAESG